MRYVTENNFDEVWKIIKDNKKWFPHVRSFHVKNRLKWGQVILDDGVLIAQQQYKRNGKIGRDSNVSVKKGDYIIHQIINSQQGNGNAEKVIKEYFDHVKANVYLTVRSENISANKFYEKVGMKKVGFINWSKGQLKGNVWKFKNNT